MKRLFIGGPLHGKTRDIRDDARRVEVPQYDNLKWVGPELYAPDMGSPGFQSSHYERKQIGFSEQFTARHDDINTGIYINTQVTVYVHESVLTVEEAAAYYKKLRPNDVKGSVRGTLDMMKMPHGR